MSETRIPGGCAVHGPAHIGSSCPDASASDVVANPSEEYGDLETMFQMENLGENFDSVKEQLEVLQEKIKKYNQLSEEYKQDLGMDHYVDEAMYQLEDAYKNFSINGKRFDIRVLCEGKQFDPDINVDDYNKIVFAINGYIDMYMIGQNIELLQEM